MSRFLARYSGRCPACHEVIEVGDELTWEDDTAVHVECTTPTRHTNRPASVCPSCNMTVPASGVCDCRA